MPRTSFVSHPNMLGFERLEGLIERCVKTGGDSFPPFNIEVRDGGKYRISLAVAGYGLDDLSITLEGTELTVQGRKPAGSDKQEFLHRGIAGRQFRKQFLLAPQLELVGAALANGLLDIDFIWQPEESAVQRVPISRK